MNKGNTYELGKRCELPRYSRFRTLYPVVRDGTLFCFLGMRTGWGRTWEFYPLMAGTSKVSVDGFEPNVPKFASYYGREGREGAVAQLREGRISGMDNGYFKDAGELRAAEVDRLAAMRERLVKTLAKLQNSIADKQRNRNALDAMLRTFRLEHDERTAISEAVKYLDGEISSYARSIAQIEQELLDASGQ